MGEPRLLVPDLTRGLRQGSCGLTCLEWSVLSAIASTAYAVFAFEPSGAWLWGFGRPLVLLGAAASLVSAVWFLASAMELDHAREWARQGLMALERYGFAVEAPRVTTMDVAPPLVRLRVVAAGAVVVAAFWLPLNLGFLVASCVGGFTWAECLREGRWLRREIDHTWSLGQAVALLRLGVDTLAMRQRVQDAA